jgi:hypothetical protein
MFSLLPPLSEFVTVERHSADGHHWVEARLCADRRSLAAFRVALHIVNHHCGGAPQYIGAWLERYQGGPPHEPDFLACLEPFIASESIGTPSNPSKDQHLTGFVAEHLWHLLSLEDASGLGSLVRIEGPDWTVTSSGGDGLTIHRPDGALIFRLWESKAHTGSGAVRDVVNGACRQISSNALRYLARFSKIGQGLPDEELQQFYGRLPELWRHSERTAGAGVSVGTGSEDANEAFAGFSNYWEFNHDDQRQGLVVVIDGFVDFAQSVRDELWKGL